MASLMQYWMNGAMEHTKLHSSGIGKLIARDHIKSTARTLPSVDTSSISTQCTNATKTTIVLGKWKLYWWHRIVERWTKGEPKSCYRATQHWILCTSSSPAFQSIGVCYRATLSRHNHAASLSDLVTLLQSMCLCAQAQLWKHHVHLLQQTVQKSKESRQQKIKKSCI